MHKLWVLRSLFFGALFAIVAAAIFRTATAPENFAGPLIPVDHPPNASAPGESDIEAVTDAMARATEPTHFTVRVQQIPPGQFLRGTSFPLGNGLWLTARHLASNQCGQIIMMVGRSRIAANVKFLDPQADLAVLQTSGNASSALAIDSAVPSGTAFAFGFPLGAVGATKNRLIGRSHMKLGGRLSGQAPVLVWSEEERFPSGIRTLGGISGGPMLDARGNVRGLVVASAFRRGRLYTVAPEILDQVRQQLGLSAAGAATGTTIEPASLSASANRLSRTSLISETYCRG